MNKLTTSEPIPRLSVKKRTAALILSATLLVPGTATLAYADIAESNDSLASQAMPVNDIMLAAEEGEGGATEASETASSRDYFEANGSTDALEVLDDTTTNTATDLGAANDATSLDNLQSSLGFIKKLNELRNAEGVGELRISDKLMAIAQVQLNATVAAGDGEHSNLYGMDEFLLSGNSDPELFENWCAEAKAAIEEHPEYVSGEVVDFDDPDFLKVMDYLMLFGGFTHIGGATIQDATGDGSTAYLNYVFDFSFEEDDASYTVAEFEQKLTEFMQSLGGSDNGDQGDTGGDNTGGSDDGNDDGNGDNTGGDTGDDSGNTGNQGGDNAGGDDNTGDDSGNTGDNEGTSGEGSDKDTENNNADKDATNADENKGVAGTVDGSTTEKTADNSTTSASSDNQLPQTGDGSLAAAGATGFLAILAAGVMSLARRFGFDK